MRLSTATKMFLLSAVLLVLLLSLVITGCGTRNVQLEPHLKPQAALQTTPYVEFMGDEQIAGLIAYAGNPLWKCTTCVTGQVSAQVLAEVPTVIALHPDIIVIQIGAHDIVDGLENQPVPPTFHNIQAAQAEILNAGIVAVVSALPASDLYDYYGFDDGLQFEAGAELIENLFTFNYVATDLTTGIEYSQDGLAKVYPAFYAEVESFGRGGLK